MKKNENNLRKVWKVQKTAVSLHCVRGDTNTTTKNFQKQKTQVSWQRKLHQQLARFSTLNF